MLPHDNPPRLRRLDTSGEAFLHNQDPERTWTLEIRLQSIGRRDSLLKGKMTPRLGDKAHDTARFHQTYYYVACIPSDRGNGPATNPGYWSLISQFSYGIGLQLLCWIFPGNARTRVCRGKGLSNRVAICGGRLHTPFCAETARLRPFAPVGGTMWAASPARNSRPYRIGSDEAVQGGNGFLD